MISPLRSSGVLLVHFSSLHNYGTGMMGINLLHHLRLRRPGLDVFASDFDGEEDIAALRGELGAAGEGVAFKRKDYLALERRLQVSTKLRKLSFVPGLRRLLDVLPARLASRYRDVVFLGGDGLWEGYYKDGEVPLLQFFQEVEKHARLYLAGQTIAPFSNPRNVERLRSLKNTVIYARDEAGWRYLTEEVGMSPELAKRSSDLALLPLPRQDEPELWEEVSARYGLVSGEYVTLVMSGMASYYTENVEDFERAWAALIRRLLAERRLEGKKLCILVHVFAVFGGKPEREVARTVFGMLSAAERERVVLIDEEVRPTRARLVLGHSLFVITSRMHASVSSYQMGVPAVVLAYGPKYKGLVGEGLGCDDLLVVADDSGKWTSGGIVEEVMEKAGYVLERRDALCDRIREAVAAEAGYVEGALDDMVQRFAR